MPIAIIINRHAARATCGHQRLARSVICDPEQIVIIERTHQAIDLLAKMLCNTGDRMWVKEPNLSRPISQRATRCFGGAQSVASIKRLFRTDIAADHQVAAILFELVQGEGGFNIAPPEFLLGLRARCAIGTVF